MNSRIMAAIAAVILAALVASCQYTGGTPGYIGSHYRPGGFYGSLDFPGTNVVLAWEPVPGPVTHYVIEQTAFNTNSGHYDCTRFCLSSNASFFVVTNGASCSLPVQNRFTLAAMLPGGTLSAKDTWYASWWEERGREGPPFGPPLVHDVTAGVDASGTNVEIMWMPAPGPAINYIIVRAAYDPTNTDGLDISLVGTVGTNTLRFEAVGVVQSTNDLRDIYEVAALYPGDALSAFTAAPVDPNLFLVQPPAPDGK